MKTCTKCGEEKPLTEFGKSTHAPGGKTYWCLQCKRDYNTWFRGTAAGVYQQLKGRINYANNHKDKKTYHRHNRGGDKQLLCTQEEFIPWYDSQPKICVYCGIKTEDLKSTYDVYNKNLTRLTVDCMDNEKDYTLDNMVLACGRCNIIKSDFFNHDEMVLVGNIVKQHWELN